MGGQEDDPIPSVITEMNIWSNYGMENPYDLDFDLDYSYILSTLPHLNIVGVLDADSDIDWDIYFEQVFMMVERLVAAVEAYQKYTILEYFPWFYRSKISAIREYLRTDKGLYELWHNGIYLEPMEKSDVYFEKLNSDPYSDVEVTPFFQYPEFAKFPDMDLIEQFWAWSNEELLKLGWGQYYPYIAFDYFKGTWFDISVEENTIRNRLLSTFIQNTFVLNENTIFLSMGFSLMLLCSLILISRRLQIYLWDERPYGREDEFNDQVLDVDGKFKQIKKEYRTRVPVGGPFNLLLLFIMITVYIFMGFNLIDKYVYFVIWAFVKLIVKGFIFL